MGLHVVHSTFIYLGYPSFLTKQNVMIDPSIMGFMFIPKPLL